MNTKIYKRGDVYYQEDWFGLYALYADKPDSEVWRVSASVKNSDLENGQLEVVSDETKN